MELIPFKSFLAWPGSKRRMLKNLAPLFPEKIRRYYEPFLGGGSVALAIAPRCTDMILSDKNPCLINAWQCVRDAPDVLLELFYAHKHRHDRGGRGYFDYTLKLYNSERFAGRVLGIDAAARFIYLNKACFNGKWISNKQGVLNVTPGSMCYNAKFSGTSDRIANATIVSCDFTIIESAGTGDVVYLDPPYYEGHRKISSEYGIGTFSEDDRHKMVKLAVQASSNGAIVVGSDLDCPYTRDLYTAAGFTCDTFEITYCMGLSAESRTTARGEIIYSNTFPALGALTGFYAIVP